MKNEKKKYEFLEHTADIKIKLQGETVKEIFENCVLAISEYLSRGEKVFEREEKIIEVSGDDLEGLMYNFMDEIIYLLDAENFLVSNGKVKIFEDKENSGRNKIVLQGALKGDNSKKYDHDHIKAATYSEMYFKKPSRHHANWEAQVVLDV